MYTKTALRNEYQHMVGENNRGTGIKDSLLPCITLLGRPQSPLTE